jgi:anti-sigma factor (TIGR02949 family)
MKCHEAKRHLDLFMDGELSVPENLKVLEHLNLCRPCSTVYGGEKALRGVLRSTAGSDRAPAGLAARLSASLPADVVPFVRRPSSKQRLVSFAAAAAFFLVALVFVLSSPAEKPQVFANELSRKFVETREGFCGQHRDDSMCFCNGCCSDSNSNQAAATFFKRHGARKSCDHNLQDLGYKPIGASVWRRRGQPVCWTVWRDDHGHTITHGLVTTKIAMEPGPLLVCDGVERPVELVPLEGTDKTCVFVFDDEDAAVRFRASRKAR